ncbi:hypothetical protein AVEN_172388-1 [Araneus ventricosus]|uniref:Uncharacterized protein n=1 Tax=Araneus ventricosus TaxID=182803 RepID=A0A4Y2RGN3_ARAVE|nr:hypothetical protein AVEN_172388-1 [Araneus ventricosus]
MGFNSGRVQYFPMAGRNLIIGATPIKQVNHQRLCKLSRWYLSARYAKLATFPAIPQINAMIAFFAARQRSCLAKGWPKKFHGVKTPVNQSRSHVEIRLPIFVNHLSQYLLLLFLSVFVINPRPTPEAWPKG